MTVKKLTYEEAVSLLPDGDTIHTYMQAGPTIVGADYSRKRVLDLLRNNNPELSGFMAAGIDHGMVVFLNDGILIDEPLFIQTDPEKLKAFEQPHETSETVFTGKIHDLTTADLPDAHYTFREHHRKQVADGNMLVLVGFYAPVKDSTLRLGQKFELTRKEATDAS